MHHMTQGRNDTFSWLPVPDRRMAEILFLKIDKRFFMTSRPEMLLGDGPAVKFMELSLIQERGPVKIYFMHIKYIHIKKYRDPWRRQFCG